MTRKKVNLVWIANDTSRKASLKKRRVGLMKKVSELTILCGVDAMCVIYSPDDGEPLVWPSHQVAEELLVRYHRKPEMERSKKQSTQETYLRERITKAMEHTQKHQMKNRDMEMSHLMWQLQDGKGIDNFNLNELYSLACLIEEKMKDINKRINYFNRTPTLASHNSGGHNGGGSGGSNAAADDMNSGGDNTAAEPVVTWDQWSRDVMNKNEMQGMPFGGCANYALEMMPYQHSNIGGNVSGELGMGQFPVGNFGSSTSGGNFIDFGMLPHRGSYNTDGFFGLGQAGVAGVAPPSSAQAAGYGAHDLKPSVGFYRGRSHPMELPHNFPH